MRVEGEQTDTALSSQVQVYTEDTLDQGSVKYAISYDTDCHILEPIVVQSRKDVFPLVFYMGRWVSIQKIWRFSEPPT